MQINRKRKEELECVLYGYRHSGKGRRGVSDQQLCAGRRKKIDTFVVMRQMIANQAAFGDMLAYCREKKADIYDASGRNIGKICEAAVKQKYCNREELETAITQHDHISFDIFDTLLTRKVLAPEDVFILVERRLAKDNIRISGFGKKRMQAQADLGLTNPTLNEIYEKFQRKYRITPEIAKYV